MIHWTEEALADLDSIVEYIAADQPVAAAIQSDRILNAIQQLEPFPLAGRRTKQRRVRRLTVPRTNFVVFYRVQEDGVAVLQIRHGAMLRKLREYDQP